jgi:hypothetical protein
MKTIMNKIKVTTVALAMLLLSGTMFFGCTIDDSLNNSPNDILDAKLNTQEGVFGLLVGVQTFTGDFYSSDRSRVVSLWTWQMSAPPGLGRAQPESWDNYVLDETGPPNDIWLYGYKAVKIADDVIKYTPQVVFSTDPDENLAIRGTIVGIANVCKAVCLGEMAALFGSIPVDILRDENLTPSQFASQQDAYTRVQALLDAALASITTVDLQYDLNFGGDASKWAPVIHSLKARYYLHVSNYASALAESNLGMNAGSLDAIYTDVVREYAPWGHWSIDEGAPLRPNKPYVDALKSETGDTRLAKYFAPNDNGNIVGYADPDRNQDTTIGDEADPSLISTMVIYSQYGDDFPMISGAENILIRSESKVETGDLAGALVDVNIIRKAAGLSDFTSTDKDAIIAQIMKQKSLELFLQGQDYHDMRRRKLLPQPIPGSNIRIMYPLSEKTGNPNTPQDNDNLVKPLSAY